MLPQMALRTKRKIMSKDMSKEISIKNMVCNRCIKVVRDELHTLGIESLHVDLGTVVLAKEPTGAQLEKIIAMLEENGFELLDDKRATLIENIKTLVINAIHHSKSGQLGEITFSDFLRKELHTDYSTLSTLFSQTEGITIEKYIIKQKVERVKELLVYNQLTVSEIAYELGYSSVHHLSNQFKKTTGLTPTEFRSMQANKRTPLDKV